MNKKRLLAWIVATLLFSVSALSEPMRKGPYLIYPGQNTQMTVLWQIDSATPCSLQWGRDPTYAKGSIESIEYNSDHQHKYTLTDLLPETLYYYRVIESDNQHEGSFLSAPDEDSTQAVFFVIGDTQKYPENQNSVCESMISVYQNDSSCQTFTLHTGDRVGLGDQESSWDGELFNPDYASIRQWMAEMPMQGCMGNHEGTGVLFQEYFPYPFVEARYWSFDYGPVHFTMVDQFTDYTPGSPQHDWLNLDLASTDKPWKILAFHKPAWSSGGVHPNDATAQIYLQDFCEKYEVPLVLCGHNHYYARCNYNGVVHVTTGGGGGPLYTPEGNQPFCICALKYHHFCKVEIEGNRLDLTAIDTSGQIIDQFTLDLSLQATVTPIMTHTPSPTPEQTATPTPTPLPKGPWLQCF